MGMNKFKFTRHHFIFYSCVFIVGLIITITGFKYVDPVLQKHTVVLMSWIAGIPLSVLGLIGICFYCISEPENKNEKK